VLLSARRTSVPGDPPIDLKDGGGSRGFYFPGMFAGEGPAPWRTRTTGLVQLLKDWGEGATWELVWLHDKAQRKGTFTVEIAPPDFSSAPRHFDEGAGIEVRDLTYEVRRVLRIPAEVPGVVVARTEPGDPAAQARIQPNELILEFDGRGVASAEAFGKMLDAARAEGLEQVRLVVQRLGKTRIVDLRVAAGEPEDAEGTGAEDGGD
jgi:hypothetical protein